MMESVEYKRIKERAAEYDKRLRYEDPRFSRDVSITHEDGSFFLFRRAFLMYQDNWLIVFSDRHGFHIYDFDDVIDYQESLPYYPGPTVERLT